MWEYFKKNWIGIVVGFAAEAGLAIWTGYQQEQANEKMKEDLKIEIMKQIESKESE